MPRKQNARGGRGWTCCSLHTTGFGRGGGPSRVTDRTSHRFHQPNLLPLSPTGWTDQRFGGGDIATRAKQDMPRRIFEQQQHSISGNLWWQFLKLLAPFFGTSAQNASFRPGSNPNLPAGHAFWNLLTLPARQYCPGAHKPEQPSSVSPSVSVQCHHFQ